MVTAEVNESVQMGQHEWLQLPPRELEEDILNRLQDAKDIAKDVRSQCLCKDLYDVSNNIRSLRANVLDEYHEWARDNGGESRRSSQDVQG